ncbi:MAG: hotdog fold thioesterase [candidate division WOR-3 bacterium]
MNPEVISAIKRRVEEEGYVRKMGMTLVELSEGHAVVEMVPGEDDTNIFGIVHGGAIFSLMDEAFQASCNSSGRVAVALNVSVVFHRPAYPGKKLRAESREIHRSNKTGAYEIRVTDENYSLIASCQALAYRKKEELPFV